MEIALQVGRRKSSVLRRQTTSIILSYSLWKRFAKEMVRYISISAIKLIIVSSIGEKNKRRQL